MKNEPVDDVLIARMVDILLCGATIPGWLAEPVNVSVPRRAARRAFRPDGHSTVGVVAGDESADLAAPVQACARRYLLTILVGQSGGRLRVHRLRMDGARCTPPGRVAVTAEQGGHR